MNKTRRKAIADLATQIATLCSKFEDIKSELEGLRDEEQEYYDNMPESFQNGEKGEVAQTAIGKLDDAISIIEGLEELNLDLD